MNVLARIRQAASLPAVADAAIVGLGGMTGVLAVALIGFDREGRPALWIGDDRTAPEEIRSFLDGGDDPHEDLAIARCGTLRVVPLAGSTAVAGVLQVVSSEAPSWSDLALVSAQISARLAVLGIDHPLSDHVSPIRLSERQREIAWLVARGCTNAEIARMLGCSPSTVKQQLSALLGLFDVTNRTELATITASWSTSVIAPPTRAIYTR